MRKHKVNKSIEAELRILGMKKFPFILSLTNFLLVVFFVISNFSASVLILSFVEIIGVFILSNLLAESSFLSSLQNDKFPDRTTNDFF